MITVLTGVMIVGLLVLVVLFVTRFPAPRANQIPALPDQITLPEGVEAEAITLGKGWIAVVTAQDEILILDAESGEIRQRVAIQK